MKLRYYTDKEIEILTSNIFIKEIKLKRRIEYETLFKMWCVMMRYDKPELTGKQIFERAGIDISVLNDITPYRRIGEWVKNFDKYGLNYFIPENTPYCSKEKLLEEIKEDKFKLKLMKVVLNRLKEIENEKNR